MKTRESDVNPFLQGNFAPVRRAAPSTRGSSTSP